MCTSFVSRKNDVLIAMNFDNNGMPFSVSTNNPKQFVVLVDGGRGKYPSFGVNNSGTFINNLCVESNGRGLYKRASKKVTHTSKFSGDILAGTISSNEINEYLKNIEIVNGPDFSVHNMIVDKDGNVWVVEPGRGVINSRAHEAPYFIMTNFSLCDFKETGTLVGAGVDRYTMVQKVMDTTDDLDIEEAFEILRTVKQSEGEWKTDFSMVYSQKENAVYYCLHSDFENILKYQF